MPAHIWTPWFSALGSKSGFDAIADCYADLAEHIFAVETGLSSDPEMNWRVSSLDRYRLVSNSDAHSAAGAGPRGDACSTPELDYFRRPGGAAHRRRARRHPRVLPRGGQVPRRRAPRLRGQLVAGAHPGGGGPLPGVRQAAHRRRAAPGRGAGRPAGRLRAGRRPDGHPPGPAARDPRRDQRGRRQVQDGRGPAQHAGRRARPGAGDPAHGAARRDRPGRRRAARRGDRPAAPRRGPAHPRLRRRVRRDPPVRARTSCGQSAERRAVRRPVPPVPGASDKARTAAAQEGRDEGPSRRHRRRRSHRAAVPARAVRADAGRHGGGRHRAAGPAGRDAAGGRLGAGRPAADRGRPGHRQDPDADPPHRVPVRRAGRLPGAVPGDHLHPAGRRGAARPAGRPARPGRRGRHGRHVPLAGAGDPAGAPGRGRPDRRRSGSPRSPRSWPPRARRPGCRSTRRSRDGCCPTASTCRQGAAAQDLVTWTS